MSKNHGGTPHHQPNEHKITSNRYILLGEGQDHDKWPSLRHDAKGKPKDKHGAGI